MGSHLDRDRLLLFSATEQIRGYSNISFAVFECWDDGRSNQIYVWPIPMSYLYDTEEKKIEMNTLRLNLLYRYPGRARPAGGSCGERERREGNDGNQEHWSCRHPGQLAWLDKMSPQFFAQMLTNRTGKLFGNDQKTFSSLIKLSCGSAGMKFQLFRSRRSPRARSVIFNSH